MRTALKRKETMMAYDPIADLNNRPSLPILKLYGRAPEVRLLKRLLWVHGCAQAHREWGDYNALLDDVFDGCVDQCVREFQIRRSLAVDAVVGPHTWAALGNLDGKPMRALKFDAGKPGLRERRLSFISKPENRREIYRRWRAHHKQKGWGTSSSPYANGCANCQSHIDVAIGALDRIVPNTSSRDAQGRVQPPPGLRELYEQRGYVKVDDPKQWQPGDICFTTDANRNGRPDHVVTLYQRIGTESWLCVDNRNYGEPYARNVGPGRFTPLSFVLAPPER